MDFLLQQMSEEFRKADLQWQELLRCKEEADAHCARAHARYHEAQQWRMHVQDFLHRVRERAADMNVDVPFEARVE